jgi:hypothetical protein
MFTTRGNNWGGLRRMLLAVVFLFVAALTACVFYFLRGKPAQTPAQPGTMARRSMYREHPPLNASGQFMTLDPTGRFLINSIAEKPVFITGEDAWSLQVQLSDSDIQFYLSDRASRGFNAIWVGLADNYYSKSPPHDFYGNVPFLGTDFTDENPAYWARVDQTISWAARKGITVMADPAFVGYGCSSGYCQSYRKSSTETLTTYGQFLGNRYKEFPNIIWTIGGDADPADKNVQAKLAALARGIKSADAVHLMTTENYRGTSSDDVWSGESWLDLDALYLKPIDIPAKTNTDYQAGGHPPFLFEDWYEGDYSMTELDVRKEGYWAVLSGSTLGRVFGNYAIWDFDWPPATTDPWKNQLGGPGSVGQTWLGKLFRSREHWKLVPDINHNVMTAGYDSRPFWLYGKELLRSMRHRRPLANPETLSVAARTSDGKTIIAYVPNGSAATITMDVGKITDSQSQAKCWWFNPRDGSSILIGTFAATGTRKFTPPDGNDWVLVIDSNGANLAPPGSVDL